MEPRRARDVTVLLSEYCIKYRKGLASDVISTLPPTAVAVLGPEPVKNADQESGCFSVLLLFYLAKLAVDGR